MASGAGDDGEQRVLGGQTGGEGDGLTAFELAERLLERGPGRVGRAGIVVVADELARARLGIGGGLVDGRDHRPESRVGGQPGVDGAGGKGVATRRRGAHETSASSRSVRVTSAGRATVLDDEQRLLVTDEQLDRLTDRVGGRYGRERRFHDLDDLGLEQAPGRRPRA